MHDPRFTLSSYQVRETLPSYQVRENPQLLAIVGAAGMGALGNPGIQAGMIVQRVDEDGVPMRRLFRVVRVIPGSPAGPGRLWAMPDVAQLVYEDGPRRGHDAGQEALAGLVVANPRRAWRPGDPRGPSCPPLCPACRGSGYEGGRAGPAPRCRTCLGTGTAAPPPKQSKNPCPLTKAQQRAACKVMGNPARYSRAARAFMEHKVPLLIAEGYPPKQAVAIAFNMARQQGLKVPGQKTARMKKKNAPTASKGGKLGPRPRVSGSADLSQIEDAFAPADVKRAQKRYRMFHGVDADQATVFRVDDGKPGVTRHLVVGLGETPQTSYQVPWDGSTKEDHVWVHDHPDDNRPLKVIDPKTNVVSDLPTHPRARVDDFFRD